MKKIMTSIVLSCLVVIGCSPKPTPMDKSLAALEAARKSLEASQATLDEISKQAKKDAGSQTIAESANADIQGFVSKEAERIRTQQQALDAARKEADDFRAGKSGKKRKDILDQLNSAVVNATEQTRLLDQKTKVVVDFLGNVTFSKSEIGALFRPGEYNLLAGQIAEGERLFKPIVEKLFTFSNKYKSSFKNLKGEIIVTGYSDATSIEKGSRLYKDLVSRIENDGENAPGKAELNQKLSELRAVAVKDLLLQIINKRNNNMKDEILEISIKVLGRGEQIPRGLPANIQENDHRRRVVTFYWVVLPNL